MIPKKHIALLTGSQSITESVKQCLCQWYEVELCDDIEAFKLCREDTIPDAIIIDADSTENGDIINAVTSVKNINSLFYTPIVIITSEKLIYLNDLLDLTVTLIYKPYLQKSLINALRYYYPYHAPIQKPNRNTAKDNISC